MQQHDVVAALERQLEKNAKERDWLEEQLRRARAFYLDGDGPPRRAARTTKPSAPRSKKERSAFERTPGGLSDTVERVLKEHPGASMPELLNSALKIVRTKSKDPRENLRETVRYKIKTGRIVQQGDGLHWVGK